MTNDLSGPAKTLLESLQGGEANTDEALTILLELLEEKDDPSNIEINLASSLYQFLDKLKVLEHNLGSYIKDSKELLGDTLDKLYEKNTGIGTSKMFD